MSMRYPGGLIATSPVNAAYPSGVWTQAQAIPYQSQNVWTRDQYWPYTTLLLQGNGTNGAQNNTFLDSSTNNFTITRNGNTTQGSFTPYEANGYWSNYFDGSTAWINAAASSSLAMSGNFTVEFWLYYTGTATGLSPGILTDSGTGAISTFELNNGSTYLQISGISATNTVNRTTLTSGAIGPNQWYHLAFVRNSNVITAYINGVAVSTTLTNSVTTGQLVQVGNGRSASPSVSFLGYLSNYRIVSSAVYTGNFTPPTAPLTAITGTQLLTCQGNRFVDNSSNALAFTVNGSPSVQAFQPFPGQTTYSTSVLGGSGYFDGTGDTLTTSTTQIIPTGSFTVECWAYVTGSGSNQKFVSQGSSGAAGRFSVGIEGGNWFTQIAGALIQTGTPVRSQWNYIAVTYNGSTLTMYVNGSSIGTASTSGNVQNSGLTIGQDWNSYITTGYIAEVRISNTVRTITTPTAPFTSDGNTSFLCSFTNAGISDAAMMNDLETVGNAQVSTSVVKYGTGSMAFDGSGDWLKANTGRIADFGTGDFTIEAWVYLIAHDGNQSTVFAGGINQTTYNQTNVNIDTNGTVNLNGNQPTSIAMSLNTWTHIAVSRAGGVSRIFINGVLGSSAANTTNYNGIGCFVGVRVGDTGDFGDLNGYIDDLRITKGAARYITNFTPPPARMPGQ